MLLLHLGHTGGDLTSDLFRQGLAVQDLCCQSDLGLTTRILRRNFSTLLPANQPNLQAI